MGGFEGGGHGRDDLGPQGFHASMGDHQSRMVLNQLRGQLQFQGGTCGLRRVLGLPGSLYGSAVAVEEGQRQAEAECQGTGVILLVVLDAKGPRDVRDTGGLRRRYLRGAQALHGVPSCEIGVAG